MALSSNFWYENAKKVENNAFVERLITDEFIVTIRKKINSFHTISYSNYPGEDIPKYEQELLHSIHEKVNQLGFLPIKGVEWIIRPTDSPKGLIDYLTKQNYQKILSAYKMGINLNNYSKKFNYEEFPFRILEKNILI